jgi:hypothetical protein
MKKLFLPFVTAISVLFPMAATAQWWGESFESIEYNGVIIRSDIRPRTIICPIVESQGLPCDGYQGFNASTRTHIFRNNGNWNNNRNWNNQWQNPGWNNNQHWRQPNSGWNNNGGCLFKKWTRDGGFAIGNC